VVLDYLLHDHGNAHFRGHGARATLALPLSPRRGFSLRARASACLWIAGVTLSKQGPVNCTILRRPNRKPASKPEAALIAPLPQIEDNIGREAYHAKHKSCR